MIPGQYHKEKNDVANFGKWNARRCKDFLFKNVVIAPQRFVQRCKEW
jgi:hypothetical protein